MPSNELLVVGGGIGGLSAALATARTGRAVRVLERAAEFAELGAGLQMAPNATRILARLDVLDHVVAAGVLPRRLVFRDALTGDELTYLDVGDDFRRRYGAPYVVLHRSDLLTILLEACRRAGVVLETTKNVTAVHNHPEHVEVRCADGSAYEGIAAIGADGLRSTIRTLLSADEPICSGFVAYRGTIPTDQVSARSALTEVVVWIGPGLHFVQYPLRSGEMYNQVAVFRSRQYAAGETDWGTPEELDDTFAVTCPQVRAAMPALWRHQRWPMSDRLPLEEWIIGRTALLGDAAHPMLQYLAQGANQAIEDADALAAAIEAHAGTAGGEPTAVIKALHAYQDQRIPRTARVQRIARTWGDIWHVDGLARDLRNEVFTQRPIDDYRHVDWLYQPGDHERSH